MTAFTLINKSGKYKTATAESKKGKVQTKVEYKIKDKRDAYQKKIETSKQKWKGDGSKYIVNGIK